MGSATSSWTILDRARRVMYRKYVFNAFGGTATTFVAGVGDNALLVISPALDQPKKAFAELDLVGEVAFVVAPNGFHHLGLAQWRARYPNARFFAPAASARRIAKNNRNAGALEPLASLQAELGPDLGVHPVSASRWGESYAWVRTDDGWAWYVSDLLSNWDRFPGNAFSNWIWRRAKSGPGYRFFGMVQRFNLTQKRAGLRALLAHLEERPPSIVLPSHGAPITGPHVAKETLSLVREALS